MGIGQRTTDALEADPAGHLLHEVDLPIEIGAEGGHGRLQRVVGFLGARNLDPQRRECIPDVFGVEGGAEHRVHSTRAQRDARPQDRRGVHVGHVGRDARTGHLDEQLQRAFGIARDRIGVDAPLEARSIRCAA